MADFEEVPCARWGETTIVSKSDYTCDRCGECYCEECVATFGKFPADIAKLPTVQHALTQYGEAPRDYLEEHPDEEVCGYCLYGLMWDGSVDPSGPAFMEEDRFNH